MLKETASQKSRGEALLRRGTLLSSFVVGLALLAGGWAVADPGAGSVEVASQAAASEDRRSVERQAAEILAAGGDASELLERAQTLPRTRLQRSNRGDVAKRWAAQERRQAARAGVEPFESLEKARKPDAVVNRASTAETSATSSASGDGPSEGELTAERFREIARTLEAAGSPVHWQRLERARSAYAERGRTGAQKSTAGESASSRPTPIVLRSSLLPYRPASLASRPPVLEPTVVPPYLDATDPEELPADRSASPSAPLSPAILEHAASLDYDYVAIYEYVRNEIELEWSSGSLRGAEGTLAARRGNASDQASLLVALLRSSGAAARFVEGVIEVDIERLRQDLGLASRTEVTTFLTRSGVAHQPIIRGGALAAVQIEHVWVAARLPYTNYRGAVVDRTGRTWVPLDPAWTRFETTSTSGVLDRMGFSAASFR
ncbi:MAG: transglutaminase domain-containing protein, partial [Acidobacteriota bacterium]